LADVERAVELDPDHLAILVPRVLALLEFGRVDEAEAALDAGKHPLEITEDQEGEDIQARLCLTNAAFAVERGDRKSAEVMYADCLDAYPTDPLVVFQAVDFYDAIGEPERATALLQRTFEETRETHFGFELSRRVRRLRDEERAVSQMPGDA
jgi:predicted Zn-dependent protease